jgi:hypothetical protein
MTVAGRFPVFFISGERDAGIAWADSGNTKKKKVTTPNNYLPFVFLVVGDFACMMGMRWVPEVVSSDAHQLQPGKHDAQISGGARLFWGTACHCA